MHDDKGDTTNDELDSLPIITLPNGTRAVVLIEPVRPYLGVIRGSPESSSARTTPTTASEAFPQGEPRVAKSPTTGKLRLIAVDRQPTRRTSD
ncbi:MAG TPA: hypothetical protein VJ673_11490 [Aromatoleum sp.]|uniref:hypothetical protein n=1 Tax=Aromatoleum sp. TaxID=2307007 RepID=UPI002B48EAD2|nr:hypothetical protein [Aromatoleum sp.]HJV26305.1 hypothetical protein [Aromatoleum sp.]